MGVKKYTVEMTKCEIEIFLLESLTILKLGK